MFPREHKSIIVLVKEPWIRCRSLIWSIPSMQTNMSVFNVFSRNSELQWSSSWIQFKLASKSLTRLVKVLFELLSRKPCLQKGVISDHFNFPEEELRLVDQLEFQTVFFNTSCLPSSAAVRPDWAKYSCLGNFLVPKGNFSIGQLCKANVINLSANIC